MRQRVTKLVLLLLIAVLALSACGVLSEPEAPSAPIEAVPLAAEAAAESAAPAASQATVYQITPDGSSVRFELDEDLRGERITVVGQTDQVAGELALDLANPGSAQIGVIQINARGLTTDNNFRNRAIQNEILNTGNFEFITFTPTAVNGMPASAAVGDTVEFTIDGDLTITDKTQPVTFNVSATLVSEGQIAGTATAVINRTDFGLNIPSVPSVANVEEEVDLIITFSANAS
ncbi:MAG: YceI family protein [Chloroflexota bacterium]